MRKLMSCKLINHYTDYVYTIKTLKRNLWDNPIEKKREEILDEVCGWMRRNKLKIATDKSKAILLSTARRNVNITFEIGSERIAGCEKVEYLRLIIDCTLSFGKHVMKVTEKDRLGVLQALMPNIGGGGYEAIESTLFSAVQSIVTYAATIWWRAVNVGTYKKMIASVERQTTLRICSAYRTVSK
ncbi:hypothetical protein NQ315_013767 [Exocentrus adspersus]|uniref:Reverse transcriptase domain-containing protein n=1 Tax=Exocentrus adspersus TaxID=1586481 RepID=A0AAV8W3Q2_9CUCU|nr:hypothetical protein NQ315_013767 [Exocentrus adspersus]